MKRAFLLLAYMPLFILTMFGCQHSSPKKIEDTTEIVIGYAINSYVAIIKNQEEIKQLEDLFNGAEFTESDASIQQPYLNISFSGKKSSTVFYVDDKDVIQLGDGSHMKSKQISFSKLYSIFYEYSSKKK